MISTEVYRFNSEAVSANADSGPLAVGILSDLAIDINISALAGTTPTVTFYLDREGADGNWYNVWASTTQNTTGTVSTSIGAGLAVSVSFGHTVRLRWTIGGMNSPTATFSISINGK